MVGCFLLAALVPLLSLCRKQLPGVSLELASEVAVSFCSHLSLPPPSLSLTKVKTFRFFAEVFVVSHLPPHQNYDVDPHSTIVERKAGRSSAKEALSKVESEGTTML